MNKTMDLHDRILARLQTSGATKPDTLSKELDASLAMVLVCLYDLRKEGFTAQDSGTWSAKMPE
jgi:hypothetical protein